MFNTKKSLPFASLLLCLSLSPYSVTAQTVSDLNQTDAEAEGLNMPGDAERLGVQEVGIRDYEFEPPTQPQNRPPTQLRQLDNIGLERDLEVKLVAPPNRQHTVYEDTAGVQVQVTPKSKKAKPEF